MRFIRLSICFIVFFSGLLPLCAEKVPSRTVRVPQVDSDVLYERTGNDGASSYVSEFLDNLNRYCDYNFEYVKVDLEHILPALKEGKIDIIPVFGRDADINGNLLISAVPSAVGSMVLASNRVPDMKNLRIGIMNHGPEGLRQKVFDYVRNQNITATYFYYDTFEQIHADLIEEKIDVYADIDFTVPQDFSVVATIENTFMYLVSTKANKAVFDDLNSALSMLFLLHPSFVSSLRSRYVPSARYSANKFTPKELDYIKNNKNWIIAAVMKEAPYCALNDGKFGGIIIDQIETIARNIGVKLSYIPVHTYSEALSLVRDGDADIIYAVNEFISPEDLALIKPTSSLLSQKIVCVKNLKAKLDEGAVFARIKGRQYSNNYIESHFNITQTIDFDTAAECFEALEKNSNYFTLMPLLEVEYYIMNRLCTKLTVSDEGYSVSVSIGISRKHGSELAGVLDKSIYTLTSSMFENFMERNMNANLSLVAFIKKHLIVFCILCAIFVLLLATTIFLLLMMHTKQKKDREIQQAMNLANRDSMTGLFNHIAFERMVNGILSHQGDNEIGVFIMIDIDNFKAVNDLLGHAKGDYVIVSVANILLSTFRGGDLKGRMGGDEFAVFMRNVSDLNALKRKMRILQIAIKDYFEKSGIGINVTCSIGISYCKGPQSPGTFEKIYNAADQGLYKVKKSGKNAFSIVDMVE
ncbi:GGDEF domain-containing protein [uncultured Treponema sp.]|uniref:transporter substrate-binding domain-containing diguanylate cyclase n=1 Tax=uncultured Treponema sp. TaxID=162155 RepID=UPI0025E62F38|nr:GGDEF domain-containing protein [uncultured Treponema sp.]